MSEPPTKRPKSSLPSYIAGPSTPMENPYLAHLPSHMRGSANGAGTGANPVNGVNGMGKVPNPLNGLVPRRVTVDQAKAIMVSTLHLVALTTGRRH